MNQLSLAIQNILSKTGWTKNELIVFTCLLNNPGLSLKQISTKTNVSTSSVQDSLKKLHFKKVIKQSVINQMNVYSIYDKYCLSKWLDQFVNYHQKNSKIIRKFVTSNNFDYKITTPKIKLYTGHEGVKQSYKRILKDCKGTEIFAIFSVIESIAPNLQDFLKNEYVAERSKLGIKAYNLTAFEAKTINYFIDQIDNLCDTRLVSHKYFPLLNVEINLFDDYIHIMYFDENDGFAIIIKDEKLSNLLQDIYVTIWQNKEIWDHSNTLYMTDNLSEIKHSINKRKTLYTYDLKQKWASTKPEVIKTYDNETILKLLGHEVMSDYQLPYMKKLADIVTQNGGDILNVGYGLGIIDKEIEAFRKKRKLNKHTVIELNEKLAANARKEPNLEVLEGDWHEVIQNFRGRQFDGIIYDGYPLDLEEVHRDGIVFIQSIVNRNLLKENGVLTFYVDAAEHFGSKFTEYLHGLGFEHVETVKVKIKPPDRLRQIWRKDHFLAPILKYKK